MKTLFSKFFVSYVTCFLIPLIIVGSLSYHWIERNITEQTEQSCSTMIYEVEKSIDSRFKELNEFAIQLSHTPWVRNIMYMQGQEMDQNRVKFTDLNDYVQELRGYEAMNDFVTTVSVVFPEKSLVISSAGTAKSDIFFNELYRLQKIKDDELQKIINSYGGLRVFEPQLLFSNWSSEGVLPCFQTVPSPDLKSHAVLVTCIKEEALKALLQVTQVLDNSSIYIIDEKGEEITSLNGKEEILYNIKKKNNSTSQTNGDVVKVGNIKYIAFTNISNINQWRYVMYTPQKSIIAKLQRAKYIALLLATILFLIGLTVSYLMAVHNCNPIYELVKLLKPRYSSGGLRGIDEYDLLHEAVSTLLHEDDLLRKQASQQELLLQNVSLLKVLEADSEISETQDQMQKFLSKSFTHLYFAAAVFFLKAVKGIKVSAHSRLNEYAKSINVDLSFIEVSGKKKAAIINFDSQEQFKQLTEELKFIIEEELETSCLMAVGSIQTSLKRISYSYREAMIAINYRFAGDKREIVYFSEIKASNALYYYYPTDKETQLINSLRMANYDESLALLREIIERNASICTDNIKCLFYDFKATALKVINDLEMNEFIKPENAYMQPADTIEDTEYFFTELFGDICNVINNNKKCKNEILRESIRSYMDENYNKQDMCLEKVSEIAGISPSYLSKFFKEEFGFNFLDYLNRKRIEKAKELLDGNMTIGQIAQTVGFSSDVTFRRLFKKYEGITPGAYIT